MSHKSIGYIYFAQVAGGGSIKIGFSAKYPDGRLRHLQVSCPFVLERLAYIFRDKAYEALLHERFDHLSGQGEWFRPEDDLLRFIRRCGTAWKPLSPDNPDPTPTHHAYAVYRHRERHQRALERKKRAMERYSRESRAAGCLTDKDVRHMAKLDAELKYLRTENRAAALMLGFVS